MRNLAHLAALMLGSSFAVAAVACGGGDGPPPAVPAPPAPVTTVVIDAGADPVALADAAPADPPAAPIPVATADAGATASGSDFFSCSADTDCVAVPRAGCCHNGHKEAVNTQSVDAYKSSVNCSGKHHMCPQYIVLDKRVAHCSAEKKCVMVQP